MTAGRTTRPRGPVEPARPFGAHLRLPRWVPPLLIVGLPVAMIVVQVLLYGVVALVEGDETPTDVLTPLQVLAVNLSVGLTGLLAVPLVARAAGVPWRAVISFPRRPDGRRLLHHLGIMLVLMAVGNAAMAVLAPDATTWVGFGVSGTTVALLVVVVLTMPLQSAAEELMFRGAILPAVASWVRPARAALVVGVVVSTLVFALVHGSADPWLSSYYVFFGLCAALMALVSRGLEAPIAFHVTHNVLTSVLNAVLADGGDLVLDRSVGAGGPSVLILVPVNLLAVAAVWRYERRRAARVGQ